jgi:predicted dehydrogenase
MHKVSKLNTLIVGCGNIAGGFDAARAGDALPYTHAGAFSRHQGFALAACVDPDPVKRAIFAQRWQIPASVGSIAELELAPGSIEVISICSPTICHADDVSAAIRLAPRLIFCEKPVSPDRAITARLVQDCADAGILLAVNHTRRWAPDVRQLQRDLAAGHWGKIRSASALYNKGVLNNGSHMLDLLSLLLGPLQVQAAGLPVFDYWHDDPSIPALLQSDSGIPVTLGIANATDYAVFELQIVTERGQIIMEDGGMNWRIRRVAESVEFNGYRTLDGASARCGEYAQAMSAAADEIHDAVTGGTALSSNGQSALDAQTLCERILGLAMTRFRIEPELEQA